MFCAVNEKKEIKQSKGHSIFNRLFSLKKSQTNSEINIKKVSGMVQLIGMDPPLRIIILLEGLKLYNDFGKALEYIDCTLMPRVAFVPQLMTNLPFCNTRFLWDFPKMVTLDSRWLISSQIPTQL